MHAESVARAPEVLGRHQGGGSGMPDEYEEPEVVDYGSIRDATEAQGFVNEEDGGSKLLIHHVSNPTGP